MSSRPAPGIGGIGEERDRRKYEWHAYDWFNIQYYKTKVMKENRQFWHYDLSGRVCALHMQGPEYNP